MVCGPDEGIATSLMQDGQCLEHQLLLLYSGSTYMVTLSMFNDEIVVMEMTATTQVILRKTGELLQVVIGVIVEEVLGQLRYPGARVG